MCTLKVKTASPTSHYVMLVRESKVWVDSGHLCSHSVFTYKSPAVIASAEVIEKRSRLTHPLKNTLH